MNESSALHCLYCGTPLERVRVEADDMVRPCCPGCGYVHYNGPALLVMTTIFAEGSIFLVRRGIDPFKGKWAPPGGFVEARESIETAAVREVYEESGIRLQPHDIVPFGVFSLPDLNQVHFSTLAKLEHKVAGKACPPETTEVRWFTEPEFPHDEIWDPALDFDISLVFERAVLNRFDFYQRTDQSMRLITDGAKMRDIWRGDQDDR